MVNLEQTDWGKEDINYFERASQLGYQMTHPKIYYMAHMSNLI